MSVQDNRNHILPSKTSVQELKNIKTSNMGDVNPNFLLQKKCLYIFSNHCNGHVLICQYATTKITRSWYSHRIISSAALPKHLNLHMNGWHCTLLT